MKIMAIINSRHSRCNKIDLYEAINKYFAHEYLTIEETFSYYQARQTAARAVTERYDSVIAVGGDGTINAVINEIRDTNINLGIIPSGTANDLAKYHNIPNDVNEALKLIKEGFSKKIDLIQVNDMCYASSGGIGFSSEVAFLKNSLLSRDGFFKHFLRSIGSLVYILAFFIYLFKKLYKDNTAIFDYHGNVIETSFFSFMINNQDFLGSYFKIAPGAKNDDSLADIVLIKNVRNRLQIIRLLLNVILGCHTKMNIVSKWKSEKLTIKTKKLIKYFGDGEILCQDNYFEITTLPSALNIFIPKCEDEIIAKSVNKLQEVEV